MQASLRKAIITGCAMFSMFFGAGNVVFPLSIGLSAQDQNFYAVLGLLITAVGVPFMGLTAMALYDGHYKDFFARMGSKTGFIIALVIMGLIGPFGALPRCIALTYSTVQIFTPHLSLKIFSLFSCILIFLFSIKKSKIIDVLGLVLTPLLLISLAIIIIKGILFSPQALPSPYDSLSAFLEGFKGGYQTMDLFGAFFFSSIIILSLKQDMTTSARQDHKAVLIQTLRASLVGAFLLGAVYIGFSFVSSYNSESLLDVPQDQLTAFLAIHILGPYAGVVACAAVALACLTTAIALAAVSASFIHKDLTGSKISYSIALITTLIISYFVSTLHFTGIVKLLSPILQICYPSLILLSFLNILHKVYGIQTVKGPVFALFIMTLGIYAWNFFQVVSV